MTKNSGQASIQAVEAAVQALTDMPASNGSDKPSVPADTNADLIADEASAIIKRAAGLVMDQIEASQTKLDDYRQQLINATVNAENSIKETMMKIGAIGLAAVEFDKQVDALIGGNKVLS